MLFIKRLQSQAKVKSVRSKIRKIETARKKLSNEYKRVLKSEGSRLSKQIKKQKRSQRKKRK